MSEKIYTLWEIANKLANNLPLDYVERQMASGTIYAWLTLHESKTGRPKKYATEEERLAARRESNAKANAVRKEKKLKEKNSESTNK